MASSTETPEGAAHFIDLAATLATRVGGKRKPGDAKAYSDALIAQMRQDRLFAVCIGPEFGGPGLSVRDCARITEKVARASGSAGLTYAMHMSQAFCLARHGKGAYFDDFRRRMVAEQMILASGTSEKGPRGDIFTSICSVEQAGEGRLRVVKESPNISYLDLAGAILVTANMPREGKPPRQVLVVAEMAGIVKTSPYETGFLGMTGIVNRPWKIECDFGPEAVFDETFAPIARNTMTPVIQILWAALWSGIAWTILDKAKLFVAKETDLAAEASPVIRHELTRLVNLHYTMNTMIRDAIAEFEQQAPGTALSFGPLARINRIKIVCSELLNQIAYGAIGLIGIRAYATGGPYSLAEAAADAMSAPIMVSNTRLALNNAKIETYVDETL